MKPSELPPPAQLMQFIVGKWISKPIYVAAELRIADILTKGSKTIEELAKESQSHAPSLYRVMRALASVGIFSEIESKIFALTPMAELLRSDAMRSIALLFNADWSDQAWRHFLSNVKTGKTAFEKAYGTTLSDWLEANPQASEVFNKANAIKAAGSHRGIIDAYDYSDIHTLTDLGGGLGVLMAEILSANPSMHGIIADLEQVIPETRKVIKARGHKDRCQAVVCDFFKSVPSGSDAYLLSNILHDWTDDPCRIILKNCHRAMNAASRLLVVEMVIPPGNEPSIAKLLDLEMMVMTGGRERTQVEFDDLFQTSGFKLSRIIQTRESVCILEGIPV